MSGIALRHLVFTGPGTEPAGLRFEDGLNILYGASNTGKSFAGKAVNYMLGGSKPLPGIDQRADYDAVWLGLVLPDGQEVTLYRATTGGAFRIFDGLLTAHPEGEAGQSLNEQHDPKREDNLSRYLLKALGLDGRVVVKNQSGEKDSLSFRHLAPYLIVSEETIITERSPVLASGQVINETLEKNVFRTLLTGRDDAAVVPRVSPKTHKIIREAKVELVDEWIAGIDEELGDESPSREDLAAQAARLDASLASLHADLRAHQDRIDHLVARRRELVDGHEEASARLAELEVTLQRFEKLDEVYASDIGRLQALEEGGFLLMTLAGRPCAVCGAPPEAQTHTHGAAEIARSHRAAAAEVRKIERERRDLRLTTTSLAAEAEGLRRRLVALAAEIGRAEAEIEALRPQEAQTRHGYEALLLRRGEVTHSLDLYSRRDRLVARRSQLDVPRRRGPKGEALAVGIDGTTAHAFARTVEGILRAWRFPGDPTVVFDLELQDIRIDGKERAANGKGVRALLHAAFKVGTLVYCRERGLPHPGFVVLDTPLLTYREPMRNPKHGDLAPDEEAIKRTTLADHFYAHLAGLRELGQIVVIENADPPASALELASVEVFTGEAGSGRFGFFPR